MSLATRCVACGTIFRVVQDQLKVSEGWVRCGRCDEVFNALEGLFDLDHEAPPRWTPPPSTAGADTADGIVIEPPQAPTAATAAVAYRDEPVAHDLRDEPFIEPLPRMAETAPDPEAGPVASHYFEEHQADVVFSPSHALIGRDRTDFADAELNSELLPDEERTPPAVDETGPPPAPFVPMPAFVARAERDARWRRPGRLAGLLVLALLLVVMLAGQAAHHFRDTVAARWPATRGPLERWCVFADCRLAAPRRIEDIVVENTGLTRAVAGTDTYRLAVTLHNRGTQSLAMPHLDLTLTDNSGQLVARRALAPVDFQRPAATIGAHSDLPLQMLIATGSAKVSGYTVEIFYP